VSLTPWGEVIPDKPAPPPPAKPILQVQDLHVHFRTDDGKVYAVNGVSFDVTPGESLAVVGESGCGKSVTAMTVLRLVKCPPGIVAGGKVLYRGQDLLTVSSSELRKVRGGKISMIFQDPMTSLNPFLTVRRQLTEVIELHLGLRGEAAKAKAIEALMDVGIPAPEKRLDAYPHEFSGGMRQRVMIAMSLVTSPDLLIADEPTTALDVTIQAQILDVIRRLQREKQMSLVLITHDLSVVAGMCSRVVVMYGGRVVEEASVDDLFADPRHPYTLSLLESVPRLDEPAGRKLRPIEGLPPKLTSAPTGCAFAPRCRFVREKCKKEVPRLEADIEGRKRACFVPIRRGRTLDGR
jgi:oligopeptide transport system ATP-binding protein